MSRMGNMVLDQGDLRVPMGSLFSDEFEAWSILESLDFHMIK